MKGVNYFLNVMSSFYMSVHFGYAVTKYDPLVMFKCLR